MKEIVCPKCQSKAYKRNGYTRHGKQNHRCLSCGRQFSAEVSYIELASHQDEDTLSLLGDQVAIGDLCLDM